MKRTFIIRKKDGTNIGLNITKAVSIKSPKKTFTLEEMKDGNYRLTWSDSLVANFSEIEGFVIMREELEDKE